METKYPKPRQNKLLPPRHLLLLPLLPVAECGEVASRSRTGSAPKIQSTAGTVETVYRVNLGQMVTLYSIDSRVTGYRVNPLGKSGNRVGIILDKRLPYIRFLL